MRTCTKTKVKKVITLGFIFALFSIDIGNLYSYTRYDSENSANNDHSSMEELVTSSNPVVPVWSYNTVSRNRNVAISSNGQYIAVACYDGYLYLFEKDNPIPLWSSNLGESVQSVAITPDGQYIVAGTTRDANLVYLFEKNSSTPLWSYNTGGIVMSLAISSDGQYFAAGIGRDGYCVYLFEKNSSTPLWSCLLYTSPSPRDRQRSRMPSSA